MNSRIIITQLSMELETLFRISLVVFATVTSARGADYDSVCVASCQQVFGETSSAFQPAEGSGVPPSDVNSYQEQTCIAYAEMKKCMLSCDGGSQAWSIFAAPQTSAPSANSSDSESGTGILDFCGLGEGIHDKNSEIYQDQLCAHKCQYDFQNNLVKQFNPEATGTDSQSDSQSGGIANDTDASYFYQEVCKADNDLKACMLYCKGGKQQWVEYKATPSGAAFSCREITSELCSYNCQQNFTTNSVNQNTAFHENESEAQLSDYIDYQRSICQGFDNLKSCFSNCEDGDVLWTNFVVTTNSMDNSNGEDSGSDGILDICGLGQGKGDKDSPDFEDQLCFQECQLKIFDAYTEDTDETPEDIKQICEAAAEMEECIDLCTGGPAMWERFKVDTAFEDFNNCTR